MSNCRLTSKSWQIEFRVAQARCAASVAAFQEGRAVWSVRVGIHYRAVSVESGEDLVWFWIGRHDEYDAIIGGRH
jgi:formate dehydrogenase assembly factor FdhD